MSEVCQICGLPKDLCICEKKVEQKVVVTVERRSFGKIVTLISGIDGDLKKIASFLKSKLGCGGTIKNGIIELQGDHRRRIRELLNSLGYKDVEIY
ncbi:MAG: stress response translation initiation inhibitor YciH [Candidatus Aenigmatarchaeota archaeon]